MLNERAMIREQTNQQKTRALRKALNPKATQEQAPAISTVDYDQAMEDLDRYRQEIKTARHKVSYHRSKIERFNRDVAELKELIRDIKETIPNWRRGPE